MKKQGVLNHRIMDVIFRAGHGDYLVIADAGLPIPANVVRIDLALVKGVPDFLTALNAVLEELVVEEVLIAEEMKTANPDLEREIREKILQPISLLTHAELKNFTAGALAVIRTGECTPYANIILKSGVNFWE